MGIDVKQILDLIAQQPGIRTVEVAERLDCDVALVLPAIERYIETGRIVATPIQAPNGSMIAELRFGDDHKRYIAQKAMQSKPEPEKEPETRSKVQIALDALAVRSLSTARLKHVMGIDCHPTKYLQEQIKTGQIKNYSGLWTLHEPKTDTKTESPEHVTVTGTTVVSAPDGKYQVHFAVPPGDPRVVGAEPAPAVASGFECAIWSNGALQMRRDGKDIATLTAAELAQVSKFLDGVMVQRRIPA